MSLDIASLGYAIPPSVLTDLCCRFTCNIPEEEKSELVRVCFQIELAHWFFVDHCCQPGSEFDHLAHISPVIFAYQMFQHTPYLRAHVHEVDKAWAEFRAYKNKVPVFGGILLTADLKEVLLVQGFRNQWGFPKGKINKDEDEVHCAVREVLEETGYDTSDLIRKDLYIEHCQNDRVTRLYIIVGADRDFAFRPQTAYEISQIGWFEVSKLPAYRRPGPDSTVNGHTTEHFYTVFPYMRRLWQWIKDRTEADSSGDHSNARVGRRQSPSHNAFSGANSHPELPPTPLLPSFVAGPQSASLINPKPLLLTPPMPTAQRKLDFDASIFMKESSKTKHDPPRTSLSLDMLFGRGPNNPSLSGFSAVASAVPKEEKENEFFKGPGAPAWIDFKLDYNALLSPWQRK